MTGWRVFMLECVLVPDNHHLHIFLPERRFWTKKNQKCYFYGILWHKMKLNDDSWFAFMHECVLVPDNHCLHIFFFCHSGGLKQKKTVKNANFMAFYGIF